MLAPATLAALQSTRAIPNRGVFYVADPISSIETRSFPNSARRYPRDFTFYVATHQLHSSLLPSLYFAASSSARIADKLTSLGMKPVSE